jgi:hypothetical protein
MRSRILLPILLAVTATLGAAAPAHALEVGLNKTLGNTIPFADKTKELGAGWVRIWGEWEDAEPARGQWRPDVINNMNADANAAKAKGLKVLMVIQRSPAWASGGKGGTAPPTHPADFGRAMGELAKRVPNVDAWELWNEEDSERFFAGGANPAKYAAMVKSAYPAIKAAQPRDIVVTGATTGNNFQFIEQLYAHGIKGHFDAIATHTDTACLIDGPNREYREPDGRLGRYIFSSYREVYEVMKRHGDGGKQIWMTELGWATHSTAPNSCDTGVYAGKKAAGVTEAQQAAFLTQAYQCLATDPYVGVAFWFGLQDIPGGPRGGHGLFRNNGTAKRAVSAFRNLSRGIAPRRCGGVIDKSGPEFKVSSPQDGLVFRKEMGIDVTASDPGGVGIKGVELRIDGRFYRYFGDGRAKMPILWDSREWRNGTTHKLTFVAEDSAGNKASMTLTVKKVKRLPKARTVASVGVTPVDATTVRVTGGVSTTKAQAARVSGKAVVVFQKQVGTTWKRVHKVKRGARRSVDFTKSLAPGHWRVKLVYKGRKRFKKSVSAPVEFDIAAPVPAG